MEVEAAEEGEEEAVEGMDAVDEGEHAFSGNTFMFCFFSTR
jgi:hypothetical protein